MVDNHDISAQHAKVPPIDVADSRQSHTLLLLSFAHRDALASELSHHGYHVVAARRATGIVRRFQSLNSALVVLDARNALANALAAAKALSDEVMATDANILLLYDRADAGGLADFANCGVKAMLPAPWHEAELALAIALARRQAGVRTMPERSVGQLWWHGSISSQMIIVDPASDQRMETSLFQGVHSLRGVVTQFDHVDRHRAITAFRKLRQHGGYMAFTQQHLAAGMAGQFIHHLVMTGDRIAGHAEWLDADRAEAPSGDAGSGVGLPIFAEIWAQQSAVARPEEQPSLVALIKIDALEQYSREVGVAAQETIVRSFFRHLDRGIRQSAHGGMSATYAGGGCFAIIASGPADDRGRLVELRSLVADLQSSMIATVDGNMRLRFASGAVRSDDTAAAVLARLSGRLTVPNALIQRLDVASAITEGQIVVRFQPQSVLDDDQLMGAEALARWVHPKLGELSGSTLFSAAESLGLAQQVSALVWTLALQAMATWPSTLRDMRVGLNVTANDLADPMLSERLLCLAADHGVAADRLTVEVTESVSIAQPDRAASNLVALRRAGVKVALDDFGTGYSGLAWLKQLPVDYIKVDSGFTREVHGLSRDTAVLQGVIDLANRMNLSVLAEGVETEQQRSRLFAMGCRWYQGYLKAPALSSDDFVAFASGS